MALLAADNTEYSRFDRYEPVADQIELDLPLLSRFDLLFMITDEPDEASARMRLSETVEQQDIDRATRLVG